MDDIITLYPKVSDEFTILTIPNTEKFVEKELLEKYPEVKITKRTNGAIIFQPEQRRLSDFYSLLSPLKIEDGKGAARFLFKRDWRKAYVPAGINPSLAYILCQIGSLNGKDVLFDPFCGGSTIPITALLYFKVKKVFASDVSGKAIDVSLINFQSAAVPKDCYVLFRSNVSMVKLQPKSITKVITNMPFGIRSGDHEKNIKLYNIFALKLRSLLTDDGIAVILTQEKKLVHEIMGRDFNVQLVATPEQGGLRPAIFKLTKKVIR